LWPKGPHEGGEKKKGGKKEKEKKEKIGAPLVGTVRGTGITFTPYPD